MEQQARDAAAVIRAATKHERTIVFDSSGRANIALNVATNHPECVLLLIAHEPPVISILPDAEEELVFFDQVTDTF
jgi:pimeloyl-ACP methyl ester carboxylesterase